ncbi:MAG: hypothetical protein JST49_16435 [Bacteroidetes bacterium]|nr:hypothetical protein [Bacteroidota bacterium]
MKILSYLERAWVGAAIAALIVAVYNAITLQVFDNRVYFPIFCSIFCMLLWYNVRGQRRFKEKIDTEEKQRRNQQPKQ